MTASDVASIELRYSSGPADVISDPGGAFLFLVDVGDPQAKDGTMQVDRVNCPTPR